MGTVPNDDTKDRPVVGDIVGGRLSRRGVLASGLAGMSIAALGCRSNLTSSARADGGLDLNDPETLLNLVMRMRGGGNDRIVHGWLKARRYGVVGDEITPLFDMLTGTFARYTFLESGTVQLRSFEIAFYLDMETGEVLDTYRMPYNNADIEVPKLLIGPESRYFRPVLFEEQNLYDAVEGTQSAEAIAPPGSTRIRQWLGPATETDGEISVSQSFSAVRTPLDVSASNIAYNDVVTYRARREAIDSDGISPIPSTISYTGVSSWRPWMGLVGSPGHTTAHGIGGWTFDRTKLPEEYLITGSEVFPDAFEKTEMILESGRSE